MGWQVLEACGHTHSEIDDALATAKAETDRPTIVMFRTTIGFGAPTKAGTSGIHGSKLGADEAANAKAALSLPPAPFEIPQYVRDAWLAIGSKGAGERRDWVERSERLSAAELSEFNRRIEGRRPSTFPSSTHATKAGWIDTPSKVATRKASQMALEVLTDQLPELIGGSADLSGSNLTKTTATNTAFTATSSGRYVNYGVREFAMAAAMNGLALHGGFVPYGGTFLVFSDYMRNAIRLSALMGARVMYVMTHDSIGLGEDGPTHQPVEHLASLRAIPGLNVFRPADMIEAMEAYEVALAGPSVPSLFAFSRQGVPQVRLETSSENLTAKGGYVLRDVDERDVTLIATGSEVSLAVEAAGLLAIDGVSAAVVSLPCWELFDAQPQAYRDATLGTAPRLAIEAASPFGWGRYVGSEDNVIGVTGFGASASAEELYEQFGLTPENIALQATKMLRKG
ncbi:UNVERIFIED_CONTAM: hypothetical protein GTU68_059020 [Idotea baltica]|nr:hypothetical protein [Idotea baltica]